MTSTYCEHLVCANSFPPQIYTIPQGMNTMASGFPVCTRGTTSFSQPPNLWSHFDFLCHLSTMFHLLLGPASFSTMGHSGVAYHCRKTQPCHQWYPISMLNFMLLQSKVHIPTPASKPLPNLSQLISTFRPQALVCSRAHACDWVRNLFCSFKPYFSGLTFPKTHFRAI